LRLGPDLAVCVPVHLARRRTVATPELGALPVPDSPSEVRIGEGASRFDDARICLPREVDPPVLYPGDKANIGVGIVAGRERERLVERSQDTMLDVLQLGEHETASLGDRGAAVVGQSTTLNLTFRGDQTDPEGHQNGGREGHGDEEKNYLPPASQRGCHNLQLSGLSVSYRDPPRRMSRSCKKTANDFARLPEPSSPAHTPKAWTITLAGLLGVVALNGLLRSVTFSFLVLRGRNDQAFMPLRDYAHYVRKSTPIGRPQD
jgi:hypothetical protein